MYDTISNINNKGFKMKQIKAMLAVILCVSFLSTESKAWGEREQAALLGGGIGLVLGGIIGNSNNDRRYEERRYYEERPVYVERHYYDGRESRYIGGNPNWRPPVPAPRLYIEQRPYYSDRYYYGR